MDLILNYSAKIINFSIQALKETEFTLSLSLGVVFSLMLLTVLYYWSGLAEKVENLSFGKKAAVFLLVAFFMSLLYYIFYKAGKFDKILGYYESSGIGEAVTSRISKWLE